MTALPAPTLTLDAAQKQAIQHHNAGRLPEAEQLYRAVLQAQPDHADTNHRMGVLACQLGQHAAGVPFFKAAHRANPAQTHYLFGMCECLILAGQAVEAVQHLKKAGQRGLNTPQAKAMLRQAQSAVAQAENGGLLTSDVDELVALYSSMRYDALESKAAQLAQHYPQSGLAWKAWATALVAQQKPAQEAARQAAVLLPKDNEVHHSLGMALYQAGKAVDAMASYRTALVLEPNFANAWCNLGVAQQSLGQHQAALNSYAQALQLQPQSHQALVNLSSVQKVLGYFEGAVASALQAIATNPNNPDGFTNLGAALQALEKGDEAIVAFNRALELNPLQPEVLCNLGSAQQMQGKLAEAEAAFTLALQARPNFASAHIRLGLCLQVAGHTTRALVSFEQALQLGERRAQVMLALALPHVMGTAAQVNQSRAEMEQRAQLLATNPFPIADPLAEIGLTNFYAAYHGVNDKTVQAWLAQFYEAACPMLLYTAPHCAFVETVIVPVRKTRIGFLSKYIYLHSVSRSFAKIILALSSHPSFEVVLISEYALSSTESEQVYPGFNGQHVRIPVHIARAQEAIADLSLDALVYLDIGMEPLIYFLSFARLAKVQCVLGGHPVTTGVRNMDYYISGALTEPADGDEHYTEKLVRLPLGIFYFDRPTLPSVFKTRAELGLPNDKNIYLCPMKLQKLHPDFDEAITRILQLDPNGIVVLFDDPVLASWKQLLLERQHTTIPAAVRDRVVFLPWITAYDDFLSINAAAGVVLDPFHFGIGSTIIATFAVGTPMVTKPGAFMRGRVGLAYCKMLQLMECVAHDTESYARLAVDIATLPALRERLKKKILANNDVLYGNQQPINDFAEFLITATNDVSSQVFSKTVSVVPPTDAEIQQLASLFNGQQYAQAEVMAASLITGRAASGVVWKIMGLTLQCQKKPCLEALRKATDLSPLDHEGHASLGVELLKTNQLELAIASCQRALDINPKHVETLNNLGLALKRAERYDEAVSTWQVALSINPNLPFVLCNLSGVLFDKGRLQEALLACQDALRLKPDYAEVFNNMGTILDKLGQKKEAIESYTQAIRHKPDFWDAHSNLLFCMIRADFIGAPTLLKQQLEFGEQCEARFRSTRPVHNHNRDANRALRVGIVSGDLREHAVMSFFAPVLPHVARQPGIHLVAYSNYKDDSKTRAIKPYFAHWRSVMGIYDGELAQLIASDAIDILIDLSGHTHLNRLPVFAHKPAPLQVSWMGYPGTTGLQAMDYYLSDQYFLPPGQFDDQFTEKIVHLPASAPFLPIADAPPVGPLPALANGFITFGSFNRPDKIGQPVVALWAQLLRALPSSRMVLGAMPTGSDNKVLVDWFAAEGVDAKRLSFYAACAIPEYLALHHQVDVCLDTFPYNGGTTTLHALWMGVPTLTLAGGTAAGRTGTAILGHLGLQDFVARSKPDFFSKGLALASDLKALAATRTEMRSRFEASAMGQPAVVADGLVRALRIMWQRWCAGLPAESFAVDSADEVAPKVQRMS